MKRLNPNFSSVKTLRIIQCSYNKLDSNNVESQNQVKKRKRIQPNVKTVVSFKELKLSLSIEDILLKNGFKLHEMPKYLQDNFGNLIELNNAAIRAQKSDSFFKYMMISLFLTKKIDKSLLLPQVAFISDTPQIVKQSLQLILGQEVRIFILSEKNAFSYDKTQFQQNSPQIVIGNPSRMNYNISKNQFKTQWVQYLFIDDLLQYTLFNSQQQDSLKQIINFLPDGLNKYFFYNPETTEITPTIEQILFN